MFFWDGMLRHRRSSWWGDARRVAVLPAVSFEESPVDGVFQPHAGATAPPERPPGRQPGAIAKIEDGEVAFLGRVVSERFAVQTGE